MTLTPATTTTQAVVNHHLERFAALDLQGVVADYAPDAVMIVPTGVLRGAQEITPLFQNLFAEFAKPSATFDLQQQVIEGDVAYIWWVAQTPDNTYELGTDTFFVRNGEIAVQTFAFKGDAQSLISAKSTTGYTPARPAAHMSDAAALMPSVGSGPGRSRPDGVGHAIIMHSNQ